MATTRAFTEEEIEDVLDDAVEIDSKPWRHGRKVREVFEIDGAHWAIWRHMHHEEGDQSVYPITGTKMRKVEKLVTVWEPEP